jgi:chromosome segregation protein
MYFKRLEMHGFKSFAEPVVIDFHEGITCIVGPNGSGKSNISDAIRWVLGEQSPKALRGGKMEEVIFNGTESRRPRGMAEVTLVIDNSAGILDIDYSEVAITRRMYRSGESEYMINNNACRLKDIRELIMDTGIGVDGYSIIGQGKIADIVSNKPESRRQIFEESAGVVSYKTRKAEAEKKLENTRGNLERIDDIVNEIEGRIGGLKKDSEKASRYLELREKYKDLEINITLRNIENAVKRNEQYKGDIGDFEGKINFIKNNRRSLDTEAADVQKRSGTLDKMSSDAHEKLLKNIEAVNSLTRDSRINEERMATFDRDEERLNTELDDLNRKIELASQEVSKLSGDREEVLAGSHEADNVLEEKIYAYNQIVGESSSYTKTIDEGNDKLFELHSKAASSKSEAKSIESYKNTMEKRQLQLNDELNQLNKSLGETDNQVRQVEIRTAEADSERARIEMESSKCYQSQRELDEQQERLRTSIEKLKISGTQTTSRMKTIEEMESNYEGYNYAVRYIMRSSLSGIEGVVADLMKVPQGFETAIETALGAAMQNVVCADDLSAKKAINALKVSQAGRLTFLPVESISGKKVEVDDRLKANSGFKGLGVDIIDFSPRYKNVFTYLLGRVVIVDDLNTAISLSKTAGYGLRFVTMDGEIINASGAITGGKYKNKTANILERKNEIIKLKNEAENTEIQLEEQTKELAGVNEAIKKLEKIIETLDNDRRENEKNIAALGGRKIALGKTLGDITESISKNERELDEIGRELADTDTMISRMLDESKEAENEITRISKEIELAMTDSENRRKAVEKASEEITKCRIAAGEWASKVTSAEALLKRVTGELDELRTQAESKADEIIQLGRERNRLMYGSTDNTVQLEQLEQERKSLDDFIKEITKEKEDITRRLGELNEEQQKSDGDINSYQDQKYQLEIKVAKNETQLDTMKDRLWDEFEVSYAQAIDFKRDDFAMTSSVKESRDIKNELKGLGDVNIGAIREYETVSERYNFLTEQRNDVIIAMTELESIISEMDSNITRTFRENFNQVEANFEYVFSELFGGGHAELQMENEKDPLESGIDIVAQPPGKRLQNINLMSGGEKTMTAIALMFAVLKTKPTPFCILDEVEAALDDDNIDRFSNYLKHFDQTQFALITHQKATMEHADVLYGITMPERGVSKVLSLRLGDYDPDEYTN